MVYLSIVIGDGEFRLFVSLSSCLSSVSDIVTTHAIRWLGGLEVPSIYDTQDVNSNLDVVERTGIKSHTA